MVNAQLEVEFQTLLASSGLLNEESEQIVRERRRMFMAGAGAFFGKVMSMLSPGAEPTDDDVKNLACLVVELKTFNEKVKRGEA